MKQRVLALLVVIVALGSYVGYRIRRGHAPLEWSGTVEAHTMDVGSRVGGRVLEVHVREGDNVVAGQPLVTLEKGDLPAQRFIAQGQLEQAQGVLQKVASRTLPTARRAELAEAEARLQVQQAQEAKAKLDDDRAQKLYSSGAGTRVDADNATLALRTASAQVAAQRAQKESLLHGTPEDVRSGEGMVEAAQGRLQQIDVMLNELVIRAPGASRVESLDLRPGDIIAHNAAAAKLLEPAELFVRIYVPETEIGRIHPELEVPIFVSTLSPAGPFVAASSRSPAKGNSPPETCRPQTSAPTRSSLLVSASKTVQASCGPAWPLSSGCRGERAVRQRRRRARHPGRRGWSPVR